MPFYLVCDVSWSMSGDMATLNQGVQRLRNAIVSEPTVDDVAHVCVMTFSDTAKVVLPLTQLSEHEIPALHVEGGTNYGVAFQELARVAAQDVAQPQGAGLQGLAAMRVLSYRRRATGRRLVPDVPKHADL